MTETAFLLAIISMVGVNAAMLGLVLKVATNGKPKKLDNPHAVDLDDIRVGDVSMASFRREFVEPIITAIKESAEER